MNLKKDAYSLVFAFVMMTTVLIVASTTVQNTREKIRFFRELESSAQARLAAESATELALQDIADKGAGFEQDGTDIFGADCEEATLAQATPNCETRGNYTIHATADVNETMAGINDYFYAPIPNTGTAAPKDLCSIMDSNHDPAHVCNWNKLPYGRSITLPLYSTAADGALLNPLDLGFEDHDWFLLVRTPCADGGIEMDCDRYVLDAGSSYATDDSIILWQLIGTRADGTREVMVPNDETRRLIGIESRNMAYNTEIYEDLINGESGSTHFDSAPDHTVLRTDNENTSSPYHALYQMMVDQSFVKLELQLDVISPLLEASTGVTVPYLEWQFVSSSEIPFADTKSVLVGEGYHDAASGTYYFPSIIFKNSTEESVSTYTLGN